MNNWRKAHAIIEILGALVSIAILMLGNNFGLYGFIAITIYNLLYVLWLRKKANLSINKAIADTVYVWALLVVIFISMVIINYMFNGYTNYGEFGGSDTVTYKGISALIHNPNMITAFPLWLVNLVYVVIYNIQDKKHSETQGKEEKGNEEH